jgi:hypothetical protein
MPDDTEKPKWQYWAILERVKRKSDLGDGAYAEYHHGDGIHVQIPLEKWHAMGRPNQVMIEFEDGGAHAPVGA